MNKRSIFTRLISLLMVFVLLTPLTAFAAESETQVEPRGSYYLSGYQAYCCAMGGGKVNVYFEVYGTGVMDELGVLSIEIYESINGEDFYWMKTYLHDTYTWMLAYNDDAYAQHVTYYGIAGRYYKAYVCVWGGKDGEGDARYFWTSAKLA